MKPTSLLPLSGRCRLPGLLALVLSLVGATAESNPPAKLNLSEAPISRETREATSYAPIVKKVSPSVVNIYTTKIIKERPYPNPFFEDPWFRRFFGDPGNGGGPSPRPRTQEQQNLGSGVIVTEDGYILTNNHVVEGADEIRVLLADDRKEFEARIVGTDPLTDIAVLKVDGQKFPGITITDSEKLEVGDVVLAIGNPFGVGQTVTKGIVSATGRGIGILGTGGYEDFIQTDASINPGNSGGALVDAEGRLVGINTAILSRSGGNQGIGFAIPINMARLVLDRIVKDGKVTRGYLGVLIQEVTPDLAREFGLKADQAGALIGEVTPRSPAADAGLQEGDIVTAFNGRPVPDRRQFRLMVAQTPPDTKVTLKLLRDGKEKTLTATLGELPTRDGAGGLRRQGEETRGEDTLDGVTVDDLSARTRSQFDIPNNIRGAIVAEVDPESPAYRAGLRPGHVILEIDRKPVRSADDAIELSRDLKSSVLLRVWTGGGSRYIVVDNSKRRR